MIGSLLNAVMGRSNYSAHGHKINTKAGESAIAQTMARAGRLNAAQQYSAAAGARGAGQALGVREAQRRAQLGMGQAGEQAGILQQQLQQNVAESNQNAAMQAEQINSGISQANAKNAQGPALMALAGLGAAISDAEAKMPLQSPDPGMMGPYQQHQGPRFYRPVEAPQQQQSGGGLDIGAIAGMLSDYQAKMVSDESAKNVTNYLRPVRPAAYQYKPEFVQSGQGDPGPQVGLLAQDLERTPVGATVVERGPDGLRRVQVPQLLMLNTAADAEQQRQIDALKRRRVG